MRQTTTAPARGGPTELSDAQLDCVAGGVPGPVVGGTGGGTAIAIGAAASNTAVVEQANVFRVRLG